MTDIVSLTNPGLIPLEAITTMGVSVKEGDTPIGFFGTGLKYAIAGLLRTSHKITIWRGLERYNFSAKPADVRGKEFGFVHMTSEAGDARLGFTTHLGAHWEMWQIFRELYANCLDEDGEMSLARIVPAEGQTTIWVTGEGFARAASERDLYFLKSKPLHHGANVDIHPGISLGVYYRGVLVNKLKNTATHTYNITSQMELTEDRTLKSDWWANYYIAGALAKCDDGPLLERVFSVKDSYEAGLGYQDIGETFGETILALAERKGAAAIPHSAVQAAEAWAQREVRIGELALTATERSEIDTAKAFLERIGYPVSAPILAVETLGPGIMGLAKNDKIYLARATLTRGGNYLIGTILEEHLHLTQEFRDESRAFQDFLIDLVVKFAREARGT